jgi:hypothetical protein
MADLFSITDAGPSSPPDPWITIGTGLGYDGAILVPRAVTGGNMGPGSINVSNLYINGIAYVSPIGNYLPLSGGTLTGVLTIPALTALRLPGGISGQVLSTDGSGNISWTSPSSLPYLPLSGGTITGTLILGNASTLQVSGGASGQVLSTNGSGVLSWIPIGGLADAPNDGTLYARKSAAWAHPIHSDITDWTVTLNSALATALAPYALISNVPVGSSTTPLINGTAAIGTGTTWARADHVHPIDTSRYAASNPSNFQTGAQVSAFTAANYLNLAGGTVSGGFAAVGGITGYNAINCVASNTSNYAIFSSIDGFGRSIIRMYASQNNAIGVIDNPTLGGSITLNGNINLNANVFCSSNLNVPAQMSSNTVVTNGVTVNGQTNTAANSLAGSVYPGYNTGGTNWYFTYSGGQNVQFENGGTAYYTFNTSTGNRSWINNSAVIMQLGPTGAFGSGVLTLTSQWAFKASTSTWTVSSDSRIKNITGDYNDGLDKILKLHPVKFTYKGNDTREQLKESISEAPYPASLHYEVAKNKEEVVGLVAQELEEIFPTMVKKSESYIDGVKVEDLRFNDIGELTYALVNAVKTLAARIDYLENR